MQERPPVNRFAWLKKAEQRIEPEPVKEYVDEWGLPRIDIGNFDNSNDGAVYTQQEAIMVFFEKGSKGPLFALPLLAGETIVSVRCLYGLLED